MRQRRARDALRLHVLGESADPRYRGASHERAVHASIRHRGPRSACDARAHARHRMELASAPTRSSRRGEGPLRLRLPQRRCARGSLEARRSRDARVGRDLDDETLARSVDPDRNDATRSGSIWSTWSRTAISTARSQRSCSRSSDGLLAISTSWTTRTGRASGPASTRSSAAASARSSRSSTPACRRAAGTALALPCRSCCTSR